MAWRRMPHQVNSCCWRGAQLARSRHNARPQVTAKNAAYFASGFVSGAGGFEPGAPSFAHGLAGAVAPDAGAAGGGGALGSGTAGIALPLLHGLGLAEAVVAVASAGAAGFEQPASASAAIGTSIKARIMAEGSCKPCA